MEKEQKKKGTITVEQEEGQPGKDRLQSPRVRKLKTLKADAESLKQSLTAYKKEAAKTDPKDLQNQASINQLVSASGSRIDPEVLEHIVELLKLNVDPDKLFHMFQVLTRMENETEMVSII